MGRKIVGKKHKGVKNPEKQQLERFKKIEHKINKAPKNPDDQEISKRLLAFMKLKEKCKKKPAVKRKHKKKSNLITTDPKLKKKNKLYKTEFSAPAFNQEKDESIPEFLYRVNKTVQEVINQSKFEEKFSVKVERNTQTGEITNLVKQSADPLLQYKKNQRRINKKTKEPILTKAEKRKLKRIEKNKKKRLNTNINDFNYIKDEVRFGEVVHAPPSLVNPKKAKKESIPRPGKRNLLLSSVLKVEETNKKSLKSK